MNSRVHRLLQKSVFLLVSTYNKVGCHRLSLTADCCPPLLSLSASVFDFTFISLGTSRVVGVAGTELQLCCFTLSDGDISVCFISGASCKGKSTLSRCNTFPE